MKSRLVCEKIITALKYSGIAPFNINKKFTINKNLLHVNRIIIIMTLLMQVIPSNFLILLIKNPTLQNFGSAISSALYNLAVILLMFFTHINLHGICELINNIMRSKENLILFLNKSFKRERTWSAYSYFMAFQGSTIFFGFLCCITDYLNLGRDAMFMSSYLNYFIICYDFLYIVVVLNVYYLFKVLNKNIRVVIDIQKEAYNDGCTEIEAKGIKLKVLQMIRLLYFECDTILNIVDETDYFFAKTNFISLSNSMDATVFTIFFCFTDDRSPEGLKKYALFIYYITFMIAKSCLVLHFSRITSLKVNFLNIRACCRC